MGDLLSFDPVRRRLAATARDRVDALISADDAQARVRGMDAYALYTLIREVGVESAMDLLELSSGEQCQAIIDFDCWSRSTLDMSRLATWLIRLLQCDDEKMAELARELDTEVLGRFIREHVSIYFYRSEDDEDALDNLDGYVESSPDGVYALLMPEDPERAALIRLLIFRLYVADQDAARQFLHHARWELDSGLEETAHTIRRGRLEQYGFLPTEEAVSIYSRVDVRDEKAKAVQALQTDSSEYLDVRVFSGVDVPPPLADGLSHAVGADGSFFGAAFREACSDLRQGPPEDGLLRQMITLVNTSVMADLGDPGEPDTMMGGFRRAHAYLNIALQFLTDRDVGKAGKLLRLWPMKRLHRVGHGLTASVAAQAARLVARENLSLVDQLPASLCGPEDADLVAGLSQPRPMVSATYERWFSSLEEIEVVAHRLALLAYKELWTFALRDYRKEELVGLLTMAHVGIEDVTFDSLLATEAAVSIVSGTRAFRLLSTGELTGLLDDHVGPNGVSEAFEQALADVAVTTHSAGPSAEQLATRWAGSVMGALVDEYGGLSGDAISQPQFLPALLLGRRSDTPGTP